MDEQPVIPNEFFVRKLDNLVGPTFTIGMMTPYKALCVAAWLVFIADSNNEFNNILQQVKEMDENY